MNLKIVFISFIVSFIALLTLGFLLIGSLMNDGVIENKRAGLNFIIPHEQDINLLITVCDEKPNPADIYILLRVSACDNIVCITNIPKTTYTMVDFKRGNLQELFDWGGINCVKEAIENITDIEIDRTIQLDNDDLKEIIQYLSEINIDNDLIDEKFPEAKFVDGDCFCELLRKDPVNSMVSLKNYFNPNLDLSGFFDEMDSVCNMSVSKYDFEIRKMGFQQMIFDSNCGLVLPSVEFENIHGYDRLTDESKIKLSEVFEKTNSIK